MIETGKEFMAVVEFQILPRWFELNPRTQKDYVAQLGNLFKRYSQVQSRWYDADAWTSELSDFVICEFEDLDAYNDLWSELRRHPFLATPYAKIGSVIMGMELDIEGLASLADHEAAIQTENIRPGSTSKPEKPKRRAKPSRPPSIEKPEKQYLPPSKEGQDPDLLSCRYCGHQIRRKARFCSRCGTSVESPAESQRS